MSRREAVEFRQATDDDADAFGRLGRVAFNVPKEWAERLRARFRGERGMVATAGGEVVGTAQAFLIDQWFGGRPVPTAGIATVTTDPLYRGIGIGHEVMRRILERERDRGRPLSTLYPAVVGFYRRLGFEFAGVQVTHRVPIGALPSGGDAGRLWEVGEDGVDRMRATYRRVAASENGLTEGADEDWWVIRILQAWSEDVHGTVATDEEVPEGYASYEQGRDDWDIGVRCGHLMVTTRDAAMALFAYFRGFKGLGKTLEWHGPPNDPLVALLSSELTRTPEVAMNMSRLLDVAGALEARGYPPVSGSATFAVRDELFPDNGGVYLLEAEEGRVRVSRGPQDLPAGRPIGVGALSAMYTGFLSPAAAVRTGMVEADHPALPLFERLFAGPAPWTPDFF
jgi:predicted acetyltransferase